MWKNINIWVTFACRVNETLSLCCDVTNSHGLVNVP